MVEIAVPIAAAEAFEGGLTKLDEESGGLYRLVFVERDDVGALIRAVEAGDPFAVGCVGALNEFLVGMLRWRGSKAPLCFGCDLKFGSSKLPAIVGLVVPSCGDPSLVGAVGFCGRCASGAKRQAPGWGRRLAAVAAPRFREIWPDFRVVDAIHFAAPGGSDLRPVRSA